MHHLLFEHQDALWQLSRICDRPQTRWNAIFTSIN
jgi:hypothetical protein